MARRLTTNQKIAGSIPASVSILFFCLVPVIWLVNRVWSIKFFFFSDFFFSGGFAF